MAFFHQLKLLLWKNGLRAIRQPTWSLTLIIWPLIVFVIIAVTRNQFPPVLKDTCYVAPRNLPSTGFFPFLQTLMCNTDSYCHNKSQVNPLPSKHGRHQQRRPRSPFTPRRHPLAAILGDDSLLRINISQESMSDATTLITFMNSIFDPSQPQMMSNASLTNAMNASLLGDQYLSELKVSMTLLKRTICQTVLPMMNMSLPSHLTFAVVKFCNSNNTVFEVTLVTINQILIDLMLTKPDEMANFVGGTLMLFDHLQSQTSLWEAFLTLPDLFTSSSVDKIANTTEALLTNIQGVLHVIQTNFPNISSSVHYVHPVLAGGLSITNYIQNWPGKQVSISLGDVLMMNNSLSEVIKSFLQGVEIPLDKAIALTLDSDLVRGFVCNNEDNPIWLNALCMGGTVDMFLGWIPRDILAKQILLKWSKHVAQHDLLFAEGLLEGLMGISSRGGGWRAKFQHSVETQPENIDEDLFLSVGKVVLDVLSMSPNVSAVVQAILRTGLESMETATLTLQTVEKMVTNVLKDANRLQMNYLTLMTNKTQARVWIDRFMANVLDVFTESVASESVTCEDVLGRFEWLLATENIGIEGWQSVICQNDSILPVLLFDWMPLINKVHKLYNSTQELGGNPVTLHMILSEWHLLYNKTQQFGGLWERVTGEMGAEYWMNWMRENDTSVFTEALQDSVVPFLLRIGQAIEQSKLWPTVKDYFHMGYWILTYRAGFTTQPPNCTFDLTTSQIHCDTGLNWQFFFHTMSQTLMSPPQDVLLNLLKGSVNLLQHLYGDVFKSMVSTYLKSEIVGGDALSDFLINLINNLNDFAQNLTRLPDQSFSNPSVMLPLYSHLLQSTGLGPLLPVILNDGPLNITQVFEVVSKLGRLNQHIFTFNETDPTMPELERLIMQFLSSEGNLTMSLALTMGNTLLTYSQYISPEYVARLREALQPFTNQTSSGIVEAILRAIELVKTVMDSPDGNPTTVILGYIRQLQECIMSLVRLRRTVQLVLPNGQLMTAQVTDLYQPTAEFLNLLTPAGLESLAQVGPNVAQDIIAQKFVAFLPAEVRQQAAMFLHDFKVLQHQMTQCATGQNCLDGISEIFTFLDQILDMMVSANGTVHINIAAANSFLGGQEHEELASTMLFLLLSPNDAVSVTTFRQTLLFIRLLMANPNITVSHVQNALQQSNLTIEQLNTIASLAGAGNINDLVVKMLTLIRSYQCFELHPASEVTTQCVVELANGISNFLMHVPALQNQRAILSIIPVIVNKTANNIAHANFSSNPDRVVFQIMNNTLANVKMALHMNNLLTPEIMNELTVLENILKVAADPTPLKYIFDLTMESDQLLAQKAVQEIIMWYLKRLENATSSSSISDLLYPFFHVSQMQVALQLAQANVSIFISNQIEHLMSSLQYPLDAEGLRKIGQAAVEILQRMVKLVMGTLDAQNSIAEMLGSVLPFNTTILDATELQVTLYLNFVQQWLTQLKAPNITIQELNYIAAQAGAASVGDLVTKIMALVNYHQCFERHPGSEGISHCVMGLMNGMSSFLIHIPALKNETAILSLIPVIVNRTISDIMHVNFSSNPHKAVMETLNITLASIKMTLQLNNLSDPEIMTEIRLIENLLKVGADPTFLSNFYNASMHPDPLHAQKAVLETLSSYMKKLEQLTNGSSVSAILAPFFHVSQMQLSLQVAQTDFSIFINDRIDYLMRSLQYPLDAEGLRKIGQTTVEILRRLFELVMMNLDAQNSHALMQSSTPLFNATLLNATKTQVNLYLSIIQQWMTQQHSNLTTDELNDIAAQAGFASVSDLIVNIMTLVNSHQCFEGEPSPAGTARCVMGLIMRINSFLSHVPALKDEKDILSLIPFIFNKTLSYIMHVNFSSNPHMAVLETLNTTLDSLKRILQISNLNSSEIMNEFMMIENLLKVGADSSLLNNFLNASMHPDPLHAQKALLELLLKSLKRLENLTNGSSITHVLHSILRAAQMQVESQLAQVNFSIFIQNQIEYLTQNVQFPINAQGVRTIAEKTIEIFRRVWMLIRLNLDTENNLEIYGLEMPLNATLLAAAEVQVNFYLDIIQSWMAQPNVFVVLTSVLQYGNSSMSYATPVNDFYQLLQTILPLLNEDQRAFMTFLGNITQSLSQALTVAQQPDGLQSDHFLAAILEAIQTIMSVLSPVSGPLPASLQQSILGVVQNSVNLIVFPNSSYASARNLSLLVLKNTESIIQQIIPPTAAQYMLGGVKMITTYFETISTAADQDNFNELILNELKTIRSFFPPNNTARAYISALINITHFILASGQGNTSLFESFENVSSENIPMIIEQMGKLLNMIWRLITGFPDSLTQPGPLRAFSQLAQVLEQLIEGTATQETWHNVEMMLEALLSIVEKTEHWESAPSVVSLLEKVIGTLVQMTKAEAGLIVSLQVPVMTLMTEIARSVNTSHFNFSEFSKRMPHAIERTVIASQQANGTLECGDILKIWEGVREAAGLSNTTMAMWCNASLQPVIEANAEAQEIYAQMNMTHTGMGPVTVNATAARIVEAVQSLYYINFNKSRVMEQFVMAFSSQLSEIAGRPLSPEAQFHWSKQLQTSALQNSLMSLRMLSEELLSEFPSFRPYVDAVQKALAHILNNYDSIKDNSSSQKIFSEAATIFLSSANITSDDMFMMWGNFSDLNAASIADMVMKAVKMMVDMKVFGEAPPVYEALEQLLAYDDTRKIVQKVVQLIAGLTSTQPSGPGFLSEALLELARCSLSLLKQVMDDMAINMGPFEGLPGNIIEILRKLLSTSGVLPLMTSDMNMHQPPTHSGNHTARTRRRRELPPTPMRSPVDDFMDLIFIDYTTMFRSLSVSPTPVEMLDTAHVFFANPDLGVVVKGATREMQWDMAPPREDTIDAVLGMASILTAPEVLNMPPLDIVMNAVDMLPDGFPFSALLKNITKVLASESQENLSLMEDTINTITVLFQTSLTDPHFTEHLNHLRAQVCTLENTSTVSLLTHNLGIRPGEICHVLLPGVQNLVESLMNHTTTLFDIIYQTLVGDPSSYDIRNNWGSVFNQGWKFNISSLSTFRINITTPGPVTIGEMLRNKTAFILDVQQSTGLHQDAIYLLIEAPLPNNNLEILSWLTNLRHCNSSKSVDMEQTEEAILRLLCSMSPQQWYSLTVLMTRHLHLEKFIYRVLLPEEIQSLVVVMLQMAKVLINMMNKMLPAVGQLQHYMQSMHDLNLASIPEFHQMSRGLRKAISSKATFVTISRALCRNGIIALFGISKIPKVTESYPSLTDNEREEMIERFKIPRNATPFCTNMYLDMVNTTGGAIAWAFLKPMLMGQILYTPDTPVTRAIMEKSNLTLHEFGNLRKHSQTWIESSNYLIKSSELLSQTLPMLQNSLGNSFVKNFIEMQTDINVGRMKETLSTFSNMTEMLEKNKDLLNQITALSNLMVDLSSCIKFDRFRGYDSADQLNTDAQELAKNRDLYASVIFKLPKEEESQKSSPSPSALPPKVSYTIRMHMDNVMRTDRVRNPYFTKEPHISATMTMRYNRGFVYLQENIDRAIIETQAGHQIREPAVQLQPFPYPCHLRDEYLEAISFVFPLMLMLAWVLFVADFVKKLVHERELRLHEYMKMMGVNPLSHFCAWILECSCYLIVTIIILTLLLKHGNVLSHSDGFLLFLYLCDYGLSILAFSYLVSSCFDQTHIAGLSGSLLYIVSFFPFIVVMAVETKLTFSQKSLLSLFSPTCFSYASQYVSRYETQGQGIQWSNSYSSPIAGDTASFGWLCWLMLIDSILYFILGVYIRMVFPGKYGIAAPWYFPFKASFWTELCCSRSQSKAGKGLFFTNIMQSKQAVLSDDKGKGQSTLSSQAAEDYSELPVGVSLHGLSKIYGERVAIDNLNVAFYEGHVTSLLGHNGAGKTTTMSLLTGLFAPSSGTIEVYGKDMQTSLNAVRKDLGVCMQYDVLFDHMTTKEHLLLYGQIKAPHWSKRELREQIRTILEETGMYAHRHKRVGTLSGGMKRKLSISIAFIGGSRLVVLDEPTTGVDPCSRRNIWDIVIQHKKHRTIIMSTHHLDEAEVLSDRIAFLEKGGLKCCGSPLYLKDKLGQGYKLTVTKKTQNLESEQIDDVELKSFIQAHVPEARLKEVQGSDLIYLLPPFSSSNSSSYRSLLTALDANLDDLQLGGYGISDTTLEEVFLHMTHGSTESMADGGLLTVSETVSDSGSIDSFPTDPTTSIDGDCDQFNLTGSSVVEGAALVWQQIMAILIKRFHHSRRDWKGLISQILLPVLFVVFAMGLGSIKNDLKHYPELELSPALYNIGPSYSFFSNQNPNSSHLVDTMLSYPGIDNACLDESNDQVCSRTVKGWESTGNSSKILGTCTCLPDTQVCDAGNYHPAHKKIPSSQTVYNLSGINLENYLVVTGNDFIRNRYGGFAFGKPLPLDLQMDLRAVPKNRTLSKVWFNPEGHHTMPAYLNSLDNIILRANLPADKDPREYAISVSSHPYFGRPDDEDSIVQGMLQILIAMCVLTGYSITTASFAIYEVNEHHTGSKRLQHIAGISEPLYWTVNFIYDMALYMIPVTLTIGVVAAFQISAFTHRQNLGAVILLLILFGFATFPWMYLLSSVFKDSEMAFISYVCINLFISINTIISTSILYFLGQISVIRTEAIQEIFNKLSYAFLIFPQFNFGNGLMKLARKDIEVQILSGYGVDTYQSPFSMDTLGGVFIASFIEGVLFFTLRLLLNKYLVRKIRHLIFRRKPVPQVACEDEDEDVAAEHLRVASGAAGSDMLQVNQLTKIYQHIKKKVHAVKRLSVGIPAGECFGLLGVNGAGKTTTFKMLTGDVSPTDGTAQIRDRDGRLVDIMECRNQGINIGYCPQVDALDDLLTGEEHLYFYARVRGISKREIRGVVNYLLKRLELTYHRNIITDGYSCGTRRKLSTALALIGHPQILLLDEPSSGMDPRTKRHLWKIISEEVRGKCAVVLTSHSMEECEALCSRLAIMVKGQFRCLGSLQHIKNRFGSGFTVKMYLAEASCDAEAITGFMQRRFPSTYLKDQHSTMVEYHVPVAPGGVADIFNQLESNKNALRIKHFSVSQTTLDEVFINFAMGKVGMEVIPIDNEEFDDLGSVKEVET